MKNGVWFIAVLAEASLVFADLGLIRFARKIVACHQLVLQPEADVGFDFHFVVFDQLEQVSSFDAC